MELQWHLQGPLRPLPQHTAVGRWQLAQCLLLHFKKLISLIVWCAHLYQTHFPFLFQPSPPTPPHRLPETLQSPHIAQFVQEDASNADRDQAQYELNPDELRHRLQTLLISDPEAAVEPFTPPFNSLRHTINAITSCAQLCAPSKSSPADPSSNPDSDPATCRSPQSPNSGPILAFLPNSQLSALQRQRNSIMTCRKHRQPAGKAGGLIRGVI